MIKSFLFCFLIVVACNSSKVSSQQNKVPFDVILERATGGKTDPNIVVISDQNTLEEIYKNINSNQDPNYQVPEINFETELVIAFFMGEKNTGGYAITVDSVKELESSINVSYKESSPKPTDMVTMAFTQPFCIVKTKKTSKELKLLKLE